MILWFIAVVGIFDDKLARIHLNLQAGAPSAGLVACYAGAFVQVPLAALMLMFVDTAPFLDALCSVAAFFSQILMLVRVGTCVDAETSWFRMKFIVNYLGEGVD